MHPVLLIDEILRHIFLFCSYQDRASLVFAAQTCKAWKDPALDFLWYRLASIEPLLPILHGALSLGEAHNFQSYAHRVRHIAHRLEVKDYLGSPAYSPSTHLAQVALPNLSTVYLSLPRCPAPMMSLYMSPQLQHIEADLGFKFSKSSNEVAFCDFMEQVFVDCLELKGVNLRGLSSLRLNNIISSMGKLQNLSLRLGQSLLPSTLRAIMSFPHLSELEVHAGHVDVDDLEGNYMEVQFPSLCKLRIRAKSKLVKNILHRIQRDNLRYLHIELDDLSPSTALWSSILSLVCDQAASSLLYLQIEHHFEAPDIPTSSLLDMANVPQGSTISTMSFDDIHILRVIKNLRHFACDVTLPPLFRDKDMADLATWWPDLEHLELGSAPQGDEAESRVTGSAQITIASLASFATQSPKLEKLILPLRIGDHPLRPPASHPLVANKLRSLTIAQLTSCKPLELAEYLRRLFPLLEEFEGPCDDTRIWTDTKASLVKHRIS
ncbi:hypothetical protein M413DRAFT_67066 [Hebeloma cylindrosporum]|uniref:F-box domain-containing protein n=1 Tax=Hebeloma cylindrosporum TaxID=76867 RepID=A0A0C3CLQ7_HEBCY|nr:hypothetical protein M413DRAFT_67066 [Hebeloma cylindrosporum h7]